MTSIAGNSSSTLLRYYRHPALTNANVGSLIHELRETQFPRVKEINTEYLFLVKLKDDSVKLSLRETSILKWLLSETFEPGKTGPSSYFKPSSNGNSWEFEIGPRLSFVSAFSTNAVAICEACGVNNIERIERIVRYQVYFEQKTVVTTSNDTKNIMLSKVHDRMTMVYPKNFNSFGSVASPEPVKWFNERDGPSTRNKETMGLAFDDQI